MPVLALRLWNEPCGLRAFAEKARVAKRGANQKMRGLYVLIAQRHPKQCSITASANGLVSLANMRWLHELGRDLQKVAINRDGVWPPLGYTKRHVKAGVSSAQHTSRD